MKKILLLFSFLLIFQIGNSQFVNVISGGIEGYPTVLDDGNTVAWFDYEENITKDGSDLVSVWGDKSDEGNDLLQATGTKQPLWSSTGVLFDGVDNHLKTAAFTYEQPEMIYMVIKRVSWTVNDYLFDGNINDRGLIYSTTATPKITAYAGSASAENSNLTVGDWSILRLLFNGASSKLQINETTATTGDFGANDMGGFTLGTVGNLAVGRNANIEVKEIILRNIADSSSDEQAIYDYLESKYGL